MLLSGYREADRLALVVFHGERIVEEHHHPVAREMLERPVVRVDQLAEELVVDPQDLEQLFRSSRLGEGGEAPEIAEEAGDVGAMASKQLLAPLRRDELCDLRRDETGQLCPLSLDRLEQPRVRDRDRRLVSESLDELDLVIGEGTRSLTTDHDCTDQLLVQEDWNAKQRAVAHDLLRAVRVVGIGKYVGDLH